MAPDGNQKLISQDTKHAVGMETCQIHMSDTEVPGGAASNRLLTVSETEKA